MKEMSAEVITIRQQCSDQATNQHANDATMSGRVDGLQEMFENLQKTQDMTREDVGQLRGYMGDWTGRSEQNASALLKQLHEVTQKQEISINQLHEATQNILNRVSTTENSLGSLDQNLGVWNTSRDATLEEIRNAINRVDQLVSENEQRNSHNMGHQHQHFTSTAGTGARTGE